MAVPMMRFELFLSAVHLSKSTDLVKLIRPSLDRFIESHESMLREKLLDEDLDEDFLVSPSLTLSRLRLVELPLLLLYPSSDVVALILCFWLPLLELW